MNIKGGGFTITIVIFLGWTTLKNLISGMNYGLPYSDNPNPTTEYMYLSQN
jgi:hypothetical protein